MEHGPYIAERTQKTVYIVRCLCFLLRLFDFSALCRTWCVLVEVGSTFLWLAGIRTVLFLKTERTSVLSNSIWKVNILPFHGAKCWQGRWSRSPAGIFPTPDQIFWREKLKLTWFYTERMNRRNWDQTERLSYNMDELLFVRKMSLAWFAQHLRQSYVVHELLVHLYCIWHDSSDKNWGMS
jgi:hypothetical protein